MPGRQAEEQLARLRHVQQLVEELAGRSAVPTPEHAPIGLAYEQAPEILRRSYDALAGEIAAWAAAGVKALLRDTSNPPRSAARRLAVDLKQALTRLSALLA